MSETATERPAAGGFEMVIVMAAVGDVLATNRLPSAKLSVMVLGLVAVVSVALLTISLIAESGMENPPDAVVEIDILFDAHTLEKKSIAFELTIHYHAHSHACNDASSIPYGDTCQ